MAKPSALTTQKTPWVKIALPYMGHLVGKDQIFDVTNNLVSFSHDIIGQTAEGSRRFELKVVNPSDELETAIHNQFQTGMPSVGKTEVDPQNIKRPLALLEYGYGDPKEGMKSKVHVAMMTTQNLSFTSGKEKVLTIELMDTGIGNRIIEKQEVTETIETLFRKAPSQWDEGMDLSDFALKKPSEICHNIIKTAIDSLAGYELSSFSLGADLSGHLNSWVDTYAESAQGVGPPAVANCFGKHGYTLCALKAFCELAGLYFETHWWDLSVESTGAKIGKTPGKPTDEPDENQDGNFGTVNDQVTAWMEAQSEMIPFADSDFTTSRGYSGWVEIFGSTKCQMSSDGEFPIPQNVIAYWQENKAAVWDRPGITQGNSILEMRELNVAGAVKYFDAISKLQQSLMSEQEASKEVDAEKRKDQNKYYEPGDLQTSPHDWATAQWGFMGATSFVSLVSRSGTYTIHSVVNFIHNLIRVFGKSYDDNPKIVTWGKSLSLNRSNTIESIRTSNGIDEWTNKYAIELIHIFPQSQAYLIDDGPTNREERNLWKKVTSFPQLHSSKSDDFNNITLEYGVPDSIIQSFRWDGDVTYSLHTMTSPNQIIYDNNLLGTIWERRPLLLLSKIVTSLQDDESAKIDVPPEIKEVISNPAYRSPNHLLPFAYVISEETLNYLTGFASRVAGDLDTFKSSLAKVGTRYGAAGQDALVSLIEVLTKDKLRDQIFRGQGISGKSSHDAPGPAESTAPVESKVIQNNPWPLKNLNLIRGKDGVKDAGVALLDSYIMNREMSWRYPFSVDLQTLGIPELDNNSDVMSDNGRKVLLKIRDISKEKKAPGTRIYHWISGAYTIVGLGHTITSGGYKTKLSLLRDPYGSPEFSYMQIQSRQRGGAI